MVRNSFLPETAGIAILAVLATLIYSIFPDVSIDKVRELASENRFLGAGMLSFIMAVTTIIAPLTSLPLVPVLAPLLGPFTTGLASCIGWILGAVIAFWIGRRYGRPVVGKLINLETLDKYESHMNAETSFLLIVLLRMIIPVDVLSYALGIFTKVSFMKYTMASAIGITWFSFAFAYLGSAFIEEDYVLFAGISVASVFILGTSWYISRKLIRQ